MKRTISLVLCLVILLGLLSGVAAGENGNETVRVDMNQAAPNGVEFGDTSALKITYVDKEYYLNIGTRDKVSGGVSGASGVYYYSGTGTSSPVGYYYQLVELGNGATKEVAITDSALIQNLNNTVKGTYGDISIHMYPAQTSSANGPVIETAEADSKYAVCAKYGFDAETEGDYILTLEANNNGQISVLSVAWLKMRNMGGDASEFSGVASIKEAQSILDARKMSGVSGTVRLFLAKGEMSGQLNIPVISGAVEIFGTPETVIKGGFNIDAGATVQLIDVIFEGDGTTSEYLSDGTPNSALYGTGGAWVNGCTIRNYYYGIRVDENNTMMNVSGGGVTFENNKVGVYVDYSYQYAGGVGTLYGPTFRNNDTAILIDDLDVYALEENGLHSINAFAVMGGKFINNTVDVENNDEEVLWMPMCYFLHTKEAHADDKHLPADKHADCWQPVIKWEGSETANKHQVPAVIASPAAQAVSCNVEDGYFYPKHVYVSDDIRSLYPINALESGMAVTALDADNVAIATVELNSTAPAVEQTAARAGTYSLRRLAAPMLLNGSVPESKFDSVMTKTETAYQITLTIGAMPTGYAGTVTVPCEFAAAKVYHNGKLIASTLSDGYVTFDAVQSAARETYVIEKVTGFDTPIIVPDVPAKKDEDKTSVDVTEIYSDIAETDWFHDAVAFVTENGLMNGVGDGSFAPEQNLSRAMMWTLLARLDGVDTDGGESWYDKGLEWARENGVSDGTSPNGSITREQLVTMLWRAEGEPEGDLKALEGYADADKLSDYAREALAWAVEHGVINGRGNDILAPQGTATRAEVAQIFCNYLEKLAAAGGKREAL